MTKLITLQGLPASGKSTKAKELCEEHSAIRVNRDLLREMLHFGEYSPCNEELVKAIEIAVVATALNDGQSVVVDDCNLSESSKEMWDEFLDASGVYDHEIIFVDTPLEECIERDSKREKSVGENVIRAMHDKYLAK